MVCPICNATNPEGIKFCGQCGRSLGAAKPEEATIVIDSSAQVPPPQPPFPMRQETGPVMRTAALGVTGAGSLSGAFTGQSAQLADGVVFGGRYRIERLLGEGGMGAVYKALDLELDRTVALKLVRPELASPAAMQRFKQELLLASRISHKNILRIHDLSDAGGIKFITMAFVEGEDLASVMEREGRLPVERALKFSRQLFAALDAAHSEDVVHRDLKPQNLLIDQADNLYVSDFGLAKSVESEVTRMTRTGQIMGTPRYMSPEQVEAKEVDSRSDLYSAGLIMYEMFTGRTPFRGDSAMQLMYQRMTARPEDPRTACPGLPEYIAQVILKCLERDPEQRYHHAREILADLGAQQAPTPASGTSAPLAPPSAAALSAVKAAAASPANATINIQIPKPSKRTGLIAGVALGILAAVAIIPQSRHALLALFPGTHAGRPAIQHYLAVMPLNVLGDQESLKYLSDGVVESLSAKLGALQNVFVADPSAVAAALKRNSEDGKIARALGVKVLVKGVIQAGVNDHISITLNMEDVDKHLAVMKPTEFAGIRQDLLTLEDNAFKAIADALVIHQTSQERARTSSRPTQDSDAYELYLKGRTQMNNAQADKALALFTGATRKDNTFALAYAGVADADLLLANRTNDDAYVQHALKAAREAERLNDNLPEVHASLGAAYTRTGKTEEAIAELRRALELAPNSDEAHRRLGKAYEAANRNAEAIASYQEATAINPSLWVNFSSLARAYFNLGDNQRALEAVRHITEMEPQMASGWSSLGAAYYRLGRWNEAVTALQKAISLQPKAYYFSQLGTTQFYMGRYDEAAKLYAKAVDAEPKNFVFKANLADAYRWQGQKDKANSAYDEAIALALKNLDTNPNDTDALGVLAGCYAKKNDSTSAAGYIHRALQIKPNDPDLLDLQAQIDVLGGHTGQALDSLQQAVRNGYSVVEIQADPEFKPLRETPEFQRLPAIAPKKGGQ